MAETIDGAKREGGGEGEDDGNNGIQLGPFLLSQPPIRKALLEQLCLKGFAKWRLLSKECYEESLSAWRSNVIIKFRDFEGIVSTGDDGVRRITSLGEFLDLWEAGDWGSCPFRKFNFSFWNFDVRDVEHKRFLELVGGHVTSLTLQECSFGCPHYSRRTIYQAFPKLQVLKFADYDEPVELVPQQPPEEVLVYEEPAFGVHELKSLDISNCPRHSMMDMLSHYHKLKSLRVDPRYVAYRSLLETVTLIRAQDNTKLPLKNLDFPFTFELGRRTASCIELLKLHEQLKIPLRRLKISFFASDVNCYLNNEDVIRDTLKHHSSTLEYLEFTGGARQWLCKPFPVGIHFENLKKLVLTIRSSDNLGYLMYTPNLRVLEIGGLSSSMSESDELFSNSPQLEVGDWTLRTLTELTFSAPLSVRNLEKLMKWIPYLEKLSGVELDDVKFSMVCKNWKYLKDLVDYGEELTDEGVMGIRNAHKAGGDEEPQNASNNITKLKHLTSFKTSSSKLTSASVHDGFLKLANLERLGMGVSTEIGEDAKAALERRNIKFHLHANIAN